MFEPRIAQTVVADLTQEGKACFIIDGELFPWWISEEGPQARKIADDLYLVGVTILAGCCQEDVEAFRAGDWPVSIVIDGIQFPWYISEDGVTYRHRRGDIPKVQLEFFTRSVTGMDVTDAERPEDGKVRPLEGLVIENLNPTVVTRGESDATVDVEALQQRAQHQREHLQKRRKAAR